MNFTRSDSRTTGAPERETFTAGVTDYRWVMKDVPTLKEESFTTTIRNHIAKIEFQLSSIKYPNYPVEPILGTWSKLYEGLMKKENFGLSLDKNNGYLGDVVEGLVVGLTTDTAKARRIYNYVRQNFSCTSHSGRHCVHSINANMSTTLIFAALPKVSRTRPNCRAP